MFFLNLMVFFFEVRVIHFRIKLVYKYEYIIQLPLSLVLHATYCVSLHNFACGDRR